MNYIIRNDDPAFDTDLDNFKTFCEICDKYGFPIIQAIVPIGSVQGIKSEWSNSDIFRYSGFDLLVDNVDLFNYIVQRFEDKKDKIGIHGLWHLHEPTGKQVHSAFFMMKSWGICPEYFVTPFNEDQYLEEELGFAFGSFTVIDKSERIPYSLRISGKTNCLESYLPGYKYQNKKPESTIVYLHSWRFGHKLNERPGVVYTYEQLETCLKRLKNS